MPEAKRIRPRWYDVLLTAAVSAAAAPPQLFFYGGQAVIEGVLMRGPHEYAVAARKPDGTITISRDVLRSRLYTSKFWRLPFARGVAGLGEMLHLGMRAMQWSANIQLGDEAEITAGTMRVTIGFSLIFSLGLVIGLPLLAGSVLHSGNSHSVARILIEGAARAAILLGYLMLIGFISSVHRVFEYHGAEHKAINCLESGDPVDVEHVKKSSRLHPRCGTGFIVVVALVSTIVFSPLAVFPIWVRVLLQIALVPVVAAVSYEAIRALAKIRHTGIGRVLLAPILAAQLLSTREPSDTQMEVAIAALDAVRQDAGNVSEF
jgi:uncharacterized protein YqhQ